VIEIRPVTSAEELRQAANGIVHYFGREPPTEEWADRWLKNFELGRMLAAVDDGAIVGGAGSFAMRMTAPGGAALGTAGATVVGVLPTHRRRGILRSMMRAQLDDVHARGEPLAALWTSEETIYGRYGYGLASLVLGFEIPRVHSAYRPGIEPVGSVRLVDPETAAELMPPVYDAVQRATPGMCERPRSWWEARQLLDLPEFRFGGGPKQLAVLEVDGEPQAYAIYRLHVEFGNLGPETTLVALEVLGSTSEATRSIWRYLLDVDWTQSIAARLQPIDSPLFLLLARPNLAKPTIGDGLWVRLVDVGAALSGRSYLGDGRVVFDVRDEFCPWNAGRWKLEHGEGSRTDDEADLALDVADLASTYLGGFTFRALARAGGSRSGTTARSNGRTRSSAWTWLRGAPRSSDRPSGVRAVVRDLDRAHHQHPRERRHGHVCRDVVVEEVRKQPRDSLPVTKVRSTGLSVFRHWATIGDPRAVSSVGRAPARQAGGHWFEPSTAHHLKAP
jgi:predicted acetyltransferase